MLIAHKVWRKRIDLKRETTEFSFAKINYFGEWKRIQHCLKYFWLKTVMSKIFFFSEERKIIF